MPDQQTLAKTIKAKYPGQYDDLDDAELEKRILEKYPEYKDMPLTQSNSFLSRASEGISGLKDFATSVLKLPGQLSSHDPSVLAKGITSGVNIGTGLVQPFREFGIDRNANLADDVAERTARFLTGMVGGNYDAIDKDYKEGNYGALAGDMVVPVATSLAPKVLGSAAKRFFPKAPVETPVNIRGLIPEKTGVDFIADDFGNVGKVPDTFDFFNRENIGVPESSINPSKADMLKIPSNKGSIFDLVGKDIILDTDSIQPRPTENYFAPEQPSAVAKPLRKKVAETEATKPTSNTKPGELTSDDIKFAHAGADPYEFFEMLKNKFGPKPRAPYTGQFLSERLLNSPQGEIVKFLQNAKPLRNLEDKLRTQETSKRFQSMDSIKSEGKQWAIEMKGRMAGEYPKVGFEPIVDKFTPEQINSYYNQIKQTARDRGAQLTGIRGLDKIFDPDGSHLPQPSEMRELAKVFGKEFTDHIEELHAGIPMPALTRNFIVDMANAPKALKTGLDVSFPFRQGAGLSHQPAFKEMMKPMLESFKSEQAFKSYDHALKSDPMYELFDPHNDRGVDIGLTDLSKDLSRENLLRREEQMASKAAHKIPYVPMSERSFTMAANYLRLHSAKAILTEAKKAGIPLTKPNVELMGKYIRNVSGRGDLPKVLEKIAPELNAVFFSPKFVASRFHMLDPRNYIKLATEDLPAKMRGEYKVDTMPKLIRQHYLKSAISLVKLYGIMSTIPLAFGALMGRDINIDDNPLSTDFLKPRVGNTRIDSMTGLQQPVVRGLQFLTGKQANLSTGEDKEFTQGGRTQPISRFVRSKLSPTASFVWDMLEGKDFLGNKVYADEHTLDLFLPMIVNDLYELAKDDPELAALLAVPKVMGVGGQTFNQTSLAKDIFGRKQER